MWNINYHVWMHSISRTTLDAAVQKKTILLIGNYQPEKTCFMLDIIILFANNRWPKPNTDLNETQRLAGVCCQMFPMSRQLRCASGISVQSERVASFKPLAFQQTGQEIDRKTAVCVFCVHSNLINRLRDTSSVWFSFKNVPWDGPPSGLDLTMRGSKHING